MDTPLAGLLWEGQFEEVLMELGQEKVPNWECLFVHRKQGLFLAVYVDDIRMAGKKQNMGPIVEEIDEQRQHTKMFESRISGGATEKLPGWEKLHAKTVAWSYDMVGRAQKCVERCCELAHKKVEQPHKVSSLCLDDHQSKQEELESVGELSNVCPQIVLKCMYLARIGRHSMVCQQTCKSSHKMDSGLRQTFGNIDFIHSSHK